MRKYKRQCQQARANLMKLIEADRQAADLADVEAAYRADLAEYFATH